ncbi:hypothetical protein PoB_000775400 [Plakobranchus ocellatus]|uniref:Uncharacterized protein n=1 Tax=Plakobranchus ocellatus TaxID=259542 RepID=A0AAV3YGU8_9GAST|nr:hypothetical protein PoB_000775400 [Plakobranchus ocellatus]
MQDRPLRCHVEHRAEISGNRVKTEWSRLSATRIAIQCDQCCSRVLPLSGRQYLERLGSSAGSVKQGWLSGRQCRVNAQYSGCYHRRCPMNLTFVYADCGVLCVCGALG